MPRRSLPCCRCCKYVPLPGRFGCHAAGAGASKQRSASSPGSTSPGGTDSCPVGVQLRASLLPACSPGSSTLNSKHAGRQGKEGAWGAPAPAASAPDLQGRPGRCPACWPARPPAQTPAPALRSAAAAAARSAPRAACAAQRSISEQGCAHYDRQIAGVQPSWNRRWQVRAEASVA